MQHFRSKCCMDRKNSRLSPTGSYKYPRSPQKAISNNATFHPAFNDLDRSSKLNSSIWSQYRMTVTVLIEFRKLWLIRYPPYLPTCRYLADPEQGANWQKLALEDQTWTQGRSYQGVKVFSWEVGRWDISLWWYPRWHSWWYLGKGRSLWRWCSVLREVDASGYLFRNLQDPAPG